MMEAVRQQESGYSQWNEFLNLEKEKNCWAYTRNFQDQCGIWSRIEDKSFTVVENGQILAICPLYVSEIEGMRSFSDDGSFLRGPLVSSHVDERKSQKVVDFAHSFVDQEAVNSKIHFARFMIDPQLASKPLGNPLLEYGYLDNSLNTQILDLRLSEEDRRSDLRKSYKALINKGLRTYEVGVMNSDNPDRAIHEIYRETHRKAAGRETRPKKYFDMQFTELCAGEATLVYLRYEGRYVQLDYFNHRNGFVYYSSAADDPDFSSTCEVPLGHTILWFAQSHFKSLGFKWMEIGWQYYGPQFFESPSRKESSISYFKRGFGGSTAALFRGIKFYDEEVRSQMIKTASKKYLEDCRLLSERREEDE